MSIVYIEYRHIFRPKIAPFGILCTAPAYQIMVSVTFVTTGKRGVSGWFEGFVQLFETLG